MSVSICSSTLSCHLDTHADTCAFGKHCRVLSTYSESVNVSGFHDSMNSLKNIKIARVAVAYECPLTCQTYILIFDQVLYIPSLTTNLLCVDQMREFGVIVNDTPLIRLSPETRTPDSHCILDSNSDLRIPLQFDKPISFFQCRKPTDAECSDDLNYLHVNLTGSMPWEPYDRESFQTEEALRHAHQGDTAPHRIYAMHSEESPPDPAFRSVSALSLSTALGENMQATINGIKSNGKSYIVKPDQLARRWHCSIECARRTLDKTTQRAARDWSSVTGARRFRPTQFQLEYPRLCCDVHVDVKFGPCKSLEGHTCLAIYATPFQWARAYPLKTESDVQHSLKHLFRDVGFPRVLRPDDAKSLTEGGFRRIANKGQVPIRPHEPHHPNQNLAEDTIREGTRMYNRYMTNRNIPRVCWDRVFMYALDLRSHMVLNHPLQEGQCGATIMKGSTQDISHLTDFTIGDWCWALSPSSSNQDMKQLCRWFGPSYDVGADLCFACLNARGKYLHRSSVIPLTTAERNSEEIKRIKSRYDTELRERIKNGADPLKRPDDSEDGNAADAMYMRPMDFEDEDATPEFQRYEDEDMEDFKEPPSEESAPVEFDKYVGAKIVENEDGIKHFGVVRGRKRGPDNIPIGHYHENKFLDTSLYEVEWEDGSVDAYRANQVVEALLMNVDEEGNTLLHLKEVIDHKCDASAVRGDDAFVYVNGKKKPRRTTKGWHVCIELHGGGTEWIDLKSAKEGYPIQVAEYAVANKLVSEPAFSWWVPYTLRKRDRVIKAVKRRAFTKKNEKFGLELPGSGPRGVQRAYEIDGETNTSHWGTAMSKEVKTVLPALKILGDDETVPPGHTRIDLMTVFDVKMDLTRKARICARGDQTDPPLSVTYASVVTRESIRIGFMLAALNGLKILSADIAGAYLNVPCAEKIYTVLGPEFGDLQGRTAIVVKALYGLKSSGFSWRSTLAKTLREELEFEQCQGDMDVWRRPVEKDGREFYEYLFVYTDDVMAISDNPSAILKKLGTFYMLKPDSIDEPKTFLGATIAKHVMWGTDYHTWTIGSKQYLVEALRVVKLRISDKKYNMMLKTKVSATMPSGYKPELDKTDFVDDDTGILYMQLIGILRWLVELGRIDIATEVSMMSAYNAMPRMGHFHATLHIFSYLQANMDWELAMDPRQKEWDEIPQQNWKEFYPWATDELPPDMPKPLGVAVQLSMFVDASHASNVVTRQSRTGVIIFVNSAPVIWYSKKQNSIETSSFGSEFMALKTGVELLEGLRYKLRMMGVPLEGYCYTFVDNQSVVTNSSSPESTLKKKSNSVAYNYCRSKSAADIHRTDWVGTNFNCSDMLTKVHSGPKRAELWRMVMYPGEGIEKEKREIDAMNLEYRIYL